MSVEIQPVVITFGGGINSRRRSSDIALDECVSGENFDLDSQFRALQNRKAFDFLAIAPNGQEIRGFGQLIKQDGSVSTLAQAGTTVYSWDGATSFTEVGTVNSNARLRGPRGHNFTLDQYVILTDLNKADTVKKWDGTTFTDLAHNLGGALFAKYCRVHLERAWFANVKTTIDTPHVLLGSKIGDAEDLSNTDRPAASLGLDASFFIPMPDLRPINGLEEAFGQFLISTNRGVIHRLTGTNAFDFNLSNFHQGSAVSGNEAIVNIGNDVALGPPARIESLRGVLNFGDVETDDLSLPISNDIENVTSWELIYDRRLQKVFCFPNNQSAVYVLHKSILNSRIPEITNLSPWSKWTTKSDLDFNPTVVMAMINPLNNKDTVYMGDSFGNIYQMDGNGGSDAVPVDPSFDATAQDINPVDVALKSDGTKAFIIGSTNSQVYQYVLSREWDISSAIYDNILLDVSTENTSGVSIAFKTDGLRMYMLGLVGDTIYQYSLTTAWDLSTASYDTVSFGVGGQEIFPDSIRLRDDGTRMFIVGSGSNSVFQYDLSTAWDLGSAVYNGVFFSVASEESSTHAVAFKNDGTRMYVGGNTGSIYQYSLPTAWTMTGASYDSIFFDITSKDSGVASITLKPDGTNMFVAGDQTNLIYQFSLSTSWDLSTAADFNPTATINIIRISKLITLPGDVDLFDVEGYIDYRKQFAATVTLEFLFSGRNQPEHTKTIILPASGEVGVYNGENYYNGSGDDAIYYSANFSGRISRQGKIKSPGRGNHLQIKTSVTSSADIEIQEIGLKFRAA